jgi:hypothetical protein
MWKILIAVIVAAGLSCGAALANPFAANVCQRELPSDWDCVEVSAGDTWYQLVPDFEYRKIVQMFNRQNRELQVGEMLVFPPANKDWNQLAPFYQTDYVDKGDVIVFDPQKLAWAHYFFGQLVTWGPAVGGKDWCGDKNRGRGGACRTDVGAFHFTEAASPARRSSAYPVGCTGNGCARMPFFTRFTNGGQGIHARFMRGANASHGCIGVFAEDAEYINNRVRELAGKRSFGYFTKAQISRSKERVEFVVLPYRS